MTGQRTTPTDGRGLLAYQKRKGRKIDEAVKMTRMTRWWRGDVVMVRGIDVVLGMAMMVVFDRGGGWGFLRVFVVVVC